MSVLLAAFLSSIVAVVAVGFRDRTTSLASTIITLGVAFLAQALLLLEFGDIPRSYPGISDRAWDIGGVLVQPQYVLIAGVAILCAVALTLFLRRTIVGQALVACSDSRRAAELVGLNIRSLAVVAFAGAGALCALGGALLAPSNPMTYSSDVAITVNGFAAAVFGGLGSIRLALLGGYALGILEQLVVGYVDPQYSLIIALIVMLVLIGWRSRAEIATASHEAHAAIRRARVPWPAPIRIGLIVAGAVFACWLPYQLSTFDVALYDRMGLYALVTIGLTLLMGYAGQISLGQGAFFLIGAYTSAILTVGIDPDTRLVDPAAGISPVARGARRAGRRGSRSRPLIGVPLLRLHGHYLAFATLALHLIAFSVLSAWDRFTGGQYGISVTKPLTVFGHDLRGPLHAAVVWGVVAVALLLATNLVHSRVGRALQAIATDEASAAASGIPVASYKLRLFIVAAALAGLGGGHVHLRVPHRLARRVPHRAQHRVRRHGRRRRSRQHLRRRRRDGGHPLPRAEAPRPGGEARPVRLGPAGRGSHGVLVRRLRADPDRDHAVLPPRAASGARRRDRGRLGEDPRRPAPGRHSVSPSSRAAFCLRTSGRT